MQLELTRTEAALLRLAITELINDTKYKFTAREIADLKKLQEVLTNKFQKLLREEM